MKKRTIIEGALPHHDLSNCKPLLPNALTLRSVGPAEFAPWRGSISSDALDLESNFLDTTAICDGSSRRW